MAAGNSVQTIKLDSDAIRAITRLARAIEHQNELKIEEGRERQTQEAEMWLAKNRAFHPDMNSAERRELIRQYWPGAYLSRLGLHDPVQEQLVREAGEDIDKKIMENDG